LAACVEGLRDGTVVRVPQMPSARKARTNPTRRQREELRKRAPSRLVPDYPKGHLLKTAVYLGFYHSGIYHGVRWLRRLAGSPRAVVLLYHRVNDLTSDGLTASTTAFAEHVALLRARYRVLSTSSLLNHLEQGEHFAPTSVVVHFDDCYRDVWLNATPILRAAGLPAASFIASGFVGTDRCFDHDRNRSPFVLENLSAEEVRSLAAAGVEVGAHTINHVNLGKISEEEVVREVIGSRRDLESILGSPVVLFSFPFGRISDISDAARGVVEGSGFRALFSAHGGVIKKNCSRFDIPRRGASTEHRPLDLMMEIEGLAPGEWLPSWIRSR
jgi:peptidoglycan/xylan/chitin deacetylase (PgdA/CDA1 family)